METLPIVDFSALSLERLDSDLQDDASIDDLTKKLMDAFTTVGFVYLTNHGVSPAKVRVMVREASEARKHMHPAGWNCRPNSVKNTYHYDRETYHGYIPLAAESTNPERPGDLKESFDVFPRFMKDLPAEVESCDQRISDFYDLCGSLSARVLEVICRGLQLKDKEILRKSHTHRGSTSLSTLRLLHYPVLPPAVKPNQIRLGEHSDYGSITLLFQDDIGGLEVLNQNGEWVDATPVPGAVLVNVGDLLQRWTADKLKSTKHRVKIPAEELRRKLARYSVVYFAQPDNEYVIECLDGSRKYSSITSGEYMYQKLAATYK